MMCTRSACRPMAATGSRSTARWREQRGRSSAGSWTQGARARACARQSMCRRGQNQRTRSSDVARRRCSGRSSDHTSLRHEGFDHQQQQLLRPWTSSLFAFLCRRTSWTCVHQQLQACTLWPRQRILRRAWGTPAPTARYHCISRTCAKQSGFGGRGVDQQARHRFRYGLQVLHS